MPVRHFRNLRDKVKPWKESAARRMAKNLTPPEAALWNVLKDKRLGVCFQKQSIILGFICDFFCSKKVALIMARQLSRKMPKWKKFKAKEMAGNLTSGEKVLWKKLCNKKIGVWVYKQRPMLGYIVDFWIPCGIVIEVDGWYHRFRRVYDEKRDSVFAAHGIKTLRFSDMDVKKNIEFVVSLIKKEVKNSVVD